MTVFPIVGRELRVAARKSATWNIRWLNALGALAVFLLVVFAVEDSFGQAPGKIAFAMISFLAFVFCLFEGARQTTDCISSEKREGTLGLLFLTDLRGLDVVLGKLSATALNSIYGLLGAFPLIAITLVMGGVTVGEVVRMTVALATTLVFSACVGIWISARSRDESRPLLAALLFQLVLNLLLPIFVQSATAIPTPTALYYSSFESAYQFGPASYWSAVGSLMLGCVLLLIHAGKSTAHRWQEAPVAASTHRYLWQGSRAQRERRRKTQLDGNPIEWLAGRRRLALFGFAGLILFWSVAIAQHWIRDRESIHGWFTIWGIGLAISFKVAIIFIASLGFLEARRSGALELWLCTPLTVEQIIAGQRRALRPYLHGIILIAALIYGGMAISHFLWGWQGQRSLDLFGITPVATSYSGWIHHDDTMQTLLVGIFLLLFDVYTLTWVAMWYGLRCNSMGNSLMRSYGFVVVIPWLMVMAITFADMFTSLSFSDDETLTGILLSLAIKDILFIRWAKRRLRLDFKLIASEPLVLSPPFWQRLFRLARFIRQELSLAVDGDMPHGWRMPVWFLGATAVVLILWGGIAGSGLAAFAAAMVIVTCRLAIHRIASGTFECLLLHEPRGFAKRLCNGAPLIAAAPIGLLAINLFQAPQLTSAAGPAAVASALAILLLYALHWRSNRQKWFHK